MYGFCRSSYERGGKVLAGANMAFLFYSELASGVSASVANLPTNEGSGYALITELKVA